MKTMVKLKEEVSDYLLRDNGTLYLNMAYEEVAHPTVFCGKKKYFLTAHVDTINFYPKDLFIKGIDIVKQGQAQIAVILGNEFMREALSPENELDLIDIAENKIRKFFNTKLDPKLFILSARYRPDKQNIPVKRFVQRMIAEQKRCAGNPTLQALYEPPEPGDKFEYIVVKKPQLFTISGNKIDMKKGDQMEYVRVFMATQSTDSPMEIDLGYYLKSAIIGLFARFIAYHPKFQPPKGQFNITDKEQYREMDVYCIDKASVYLTKLCDQIAGTGKIDIAQTGREYRAVYKNTNRVIRAEMATKYAGAGIMLHEFSRIDLADNRIVALVDQLKTWALSVVRPIDARAFINNVLGRGLTLTNLMRIYVRGANNVSKQRVNSCDARERKLFNQMYNLAPEFEKIVSEHSQILMSTVLNMRLAVGDEPEYIDILTDTEAESIRKMYSYLVELAAVYEIRAGILAMSNEISIAHAKSVKTYVAPAIDVRAIVRADARAIPTIEPYEFM